MPPAPTSETAVRQHGVKGAYVGGDWVDIEECAKHFNVSGGSHTTCDNFKKGSSACATCPRSRSRYVQSKNDGSYDVIIIGAGCIGSAIARELSKSQLSVLMLEAADDVTQGATKGNSGIVHAGFDDVPGSNRAKYCWPGNQMFPALDKELHFGYQKNGSLVIATSEEDVKHLHELKKRGETNGVKRLRIVQKEELFAMEPHVNPDAIAALYAPDAGNLIPYEFAIALAENAVDNGVELRIRRTVTNISEDKELGMYTLTADHWEPAEYAASMPESEKVIATNISEVDKVMASSSQKGASRVPLGTAMIQSSVCILLSLSAVHNIAPAVSQLYAISLEKAQMIGGSVSLLLGFIYMYFLLSSNQSGTKASGGKFAAPVGTGGSKVTVDEMMVGGSGAKTALNGVTVGVETYRAKYVVNAAGGYSDKIAHMLGDNSFKIKPRLGDYLLLNRNQGHLARHTLFPCPGPLGKGVLVQTTLWGNLILGPTARDTHLPEVMAQSIEDIQRFILSKCKILVPSFDPREVIHAFCGARAKSTRGDWIIEICPSSARAVHAAGIDSPGLAGSPAIALEVVRLLTLAGLKLTPNKSFNPIRAPIITPKDGWKGLRPTAVSALPTAPTMDPKQNVVCKCEKVTEAEVITAMHRSLPVDSTQGIRKRTRAGMGHCQADEGNYNCECRIAEIISRENQSCSQEAVGRRPWPATSSLSKRWIDDEDKDSLARLMKNEEGISC